MGTKLKQKKKRSRTEPDETRNGDVRQSRQRKGRNDDELKKDEDTLPRPGGREGEGANAHA